MYSQVPDENKQMIVSYLGVPDVLKVGATNRTIRRWIGENCDKHIMRQGQKVREVAIKNKKWNEDLLLSNLMLKITDVFHVKDQVFTATSIAAKLGPHHDKKIIVGGVVAILDGEVCNFGTYPQLNSQGL